MEKLTYTDFINLLSSNTPITFETKPRKLTRLDIFLYSLAGRDFNPIHCVEDNIKYSIFKSLTSQGSGIISRFEGEFIKHMQFNEPVEIISKGKDNERNPAALIVGTKYKYLCKITSNGFYKGKQRCTCHIECISDDSNCIVFASWNWNISMIKIQLQKDENIIYRSYWGNIINFIFTRPAEKIFFAVLVILALYGPIRCFTDATKITKADPFVYECFASCM